MHIIYVQKYVIFETFSKHLLSEKDRYFQHNDERTLKDCQSIPLSSVTFDNIMGEGYFGIVYHAYYNGVEVAAKKIKSEFNNNQQFVKGNKS